MELFHIRAGLKWLFVLSLGVLALSWHGKRQKVDWRDIHPDLLREPVQTATDRQPFSFVYRGRVCRVRPVRHWEQWGLVASHNDIHAMADLVHDETSVDTKDVCVLWGANLRSNEFHKVRIHNGQFVCYFRADEPVRFSMEAAGNDHLITASDAVRDRIAQIRVGDQIRIRGLLVDYQMEDWGKDWRETSTVRTDDGCEVVFVDELEILRRSNGFWFVAFAVSKAALWVTPLLWLAVFWVESRRPDSRIGEI